MRIELNHWFVNDDELSVALMRFYVRISICLDLDDRVFYVLTVNNSNKENMYLYFPSLEDAIYFTENVINDSETLDEIRDSYNNKYNQNNKCK